MERASHRGRRVLIALAASLLLAAVIGTGVDARPATPVATTAHRSKCAEPKIVPCLGPLESEYGFTGGGEGDLSYLHAKYGKLVRTHREVYVPFFRRKLVITARKVTWKAARGVEIVAVFEVMRQVGRRHSRRLPTSPTSGHTTLEGPETYADPILVIEGRRT
jgi:hypothetical protein